MRQKRCTVLAFKIIIFFCINIHILNCHHHYLTCNQEVRRRGISRQFDEASYYQDHYDEYQDDPEDELRFPPEIFDSNDE